MKLLITLGIIPLSLLAIGQGGQLTDQQINSSGMIKIVFVESDKAADSLARFDIKNGTPFLILQSGISPTVYSTDKHFEEKYRVYYYDNGCSGPKEKLATTYNKVTFEYLTKNYGRKWTREIRKDVIGFKKRKL